MNVKSNLNELYNEWWDNRTPEEFALHGLCYEYEAEYFEDMTLQEGSLLNDVIETVYDYTDGIFLGIDNVLRIYVVDKCEEGGNYSGRYNTEEHKMEIVRKHIDDKATILHELIHFYEHQLEEDENPIIRELLIVELYNKLSKQIPDLRQRLFDHCELYSHSETFRYSGEHGVLFYLKSLDLDIRCGFPLGTVCGYGRDEMNNEISKEN